MTARRRTGSEGSATRARILDSTQQLLIDEGYAAVSTRRVAKEADLTAPLIHYYFPTTDDLLIAVYRRAAQASLERHRIAMSTDDPLNALWTASSDPAHIGLALEFLALANHRTALKAEISRYATEIRQIQISALQRYFAKQGLQAPAIPAEALPVIVAALARGLVMEANVGIDLGHGEARRYVETMLTSLSGTPDASLMRE